MTGKLVDTNDDKLQAELAAVRGRCTKLEKDQAALNKKMDQILELNVIFGESKKLGSVVK